MGLQISEIIYFFPSGAQKKMDIFGPATFLLIF
jgi:hypothetical protein